MNHRKFLQLESCTIVLPPALDTIPTASLPLCTKLFYEGPQFDAIRGFHMPTIHTLTLRSPQWSKSRGNDQLLRISQLRGFLHLTSLHLRLICSDEQLSSALRSIPNLKELVLHLNHPTALGSNFFIGFLPPSLRSEWPSRSEEIVPICPSLEVMELKYRRWFRSRELNEMPALVAMVLLVGKQHRKLNVWVEKGTHDQERVHIDPTQLSASVLCSLGLIRLFNGAEPSIQVVKDVVWVFQAALSPRYTKLCPWETMVHISPATHFNEFEISVSALASTKVYCPRRLPTLDV